MNIERAKVAPGNFHRGRAYPVDMIVIHIMDGTMKGARNWFANEAAMVSAHYGISKAGDVVQWVDEKDTAYHAGTLVNPTSDLVRRRRPRNPNGYTIGVEVEGYPDDDPPAVQLEVLARLVHEIAARHHIPLVRRHIIGHREVRQDKTCPGRIDVDEVVSRALDIRRALSRPAVEPDDPGIDGIDVVDTAIGVAEVVVPKKYSVFTRLARAVAGFFWR